MRKYFLIGQLDFDNFNLIGGLRSLDSDCFPGSVMEECPPQRRVEGDLLFGQVGLHLANDLVVNNFIIVCKAQGYPGAEVDRLLVGRCDYLRVLELLVEVAQTALQVAELSFGCTILGVLREVAQSPGRF